MEKFQCIVISLKEEFYGHADSIIGIYSEVSVHVFIQSINIHIIYINTVQ